MSIVFESNTSNRIDRSGFVHGMAFKAIYDSSDSGRFSGDRRLNSSVKVPEPADELDSCSSSSIGKNSDVSGGSSDGEADSGDGEVQSSFKGPLDCLDALEEVLPIKRGISTFYSGKSKSFTSLSDVSSCSSIKDIAKQDDAYTRKRKNLLAHSAYWDKSRNRNLENNSGGLSKRLANSSRSSIALSSMTGSSESKNNSEGLSSNSNSNSNSNSSSPNLRLPPLPRGRQSKTPNSESSASPPTPEQKFPTYRSFSLSDLQHTTTAAAVSTAFVVDKISNEQDSH